MANKSSIQIQWDKSGQINHSYSGVRLQPPKDDPELWILAPSIPLFLTHQYGSMKPSHGLIASQRVIDSLFYNRYLRTPINSALKSARLDFIYTGGQSVKIQFHPKHGFLANSDSVEEGVRQLLNNYTQYAYSQLGEYTQIVVRTISVGAIGGYFEFLLSQLEQGEIGKARDRWTAAFPAFSAQSIRLLSESYYVPKGGRSPENEEWARKQTEYLDQKRSRLESMRDSLFTEMGIY